MTANDNKSYLSYLNKLVDQYKIHMIIVLVKNLLMPIILPWLKIKTNSEAPKLKTNDRVGISKYKSFLVNITLKIGQQKCLVLTLFWKLILRL